MKSVKARFEWCKKQQPNGSDVICFINAIRGQGFSRSTIHRWFYKLVDPQDYQEVDKSDLLGYLDVVGKELRTTKIRGKLALGSVQNPTNEVSIRNKNKQKDK